MGWNNFPENWETESNTPDILEIDKIPQKYIIGDKYHCNWATSNKLVWVLISINNNIATLQTPRTKRILTTNINSLRVTNKVALRNAIKRTKTTKL